VVTEAEVAVRQQPAAFPVGLYGMLLFALCWLTLPAVFAPLERLLLGATCLLPRTVGAWSGTPAAAAAPRDRQRLAELGSELAARLQQHDVEGGRALLPRHYEPVFCTVREVLGDGPRRGGGGHPAELRLQQTHAELEDCAAFVTKGDALLGFLVRAGTGAAADDDADEPARVQLLHHRSAPPIYAAMPLGDGRELRLVVRAAATVDPAPLRVDLWDDPYTAARLDSGGQVVRTLTVDDGAVLVPPGLQLGRSRIWGYERADGEEVLTIGVFVVPPDEPRALSHVVVWRDARSGSAAAAGSSPAQPLRRHAAIVRDLPGAVHGRHLLIAGTAVPDGAAVVQDGLFLGTARGLSFGMGLVTSFPASRHRWSLLLLPDDPAARPRELFGEIVQTDGSESWLRWHHDAVGGGLERLPAGHLFTGSNGPNCPAGLWIGSAAPHPYDRSLVVVRTLTLPGPRAAEVVTATGVR
jgi:hypothetical protein